MNLINTLENIDKKVFSITQKEDGTVIVDTGGMEAPLMGGGDTFRLKKENNTWKIIQQGKWIS